MKLIKRMLSLVSGTNKHRPSNFRIYDSVIGFRGLVPGVGTSTIVANTAYALAQNTDFNVCIVDMSMEFPTQYSLLVKADVTTDDLGYKDIMDFTNEVSDVVSIGKMSNISVVGFKNRTIVDMVSSNDSKNTITALIDKLKVYYDIILIDLSHEPTVMNTYASIMCNKIINVADPSLKCMTNLRRALNSLSSAGVPFVKTKKVIMNKVISDMASNENAVVANAKLELLGSIRFSKNIYQKGITGDLIYTKKPESEDVESFSRCIDAIADNIVKRTSLNQEFIHAK